MEPPARWDVVDPDRFGNDASPRGRRILLAALVAIGLFVVGAWLWVLLVAD